MPSAFLMWAMIAFLTAFVFLFFHHTTRDARISVLVPLGCMLALALWCAIDGWEDELYTRWIKNRFQALVNAFKSVGAHSKRIWEGSRRIWGGRGNRPSAAADMAGPNP